MGDYGMVKGYAALVGVVLVVAGMLGFIDNPIVGEPATDPLLPTGTIHNIVHLATGALALYIAYGLSSPSQASGVIGFGVLNILILILTLISPNLFGILGAAPGYNVNLADQVLHAALGVVSIAVGYIARGSASTAYTR